MGTGRPYRSSCARGRSRCCTPILTLLRSGELASYRIGVLREEESRGGSRYLHDDLPVGARIQVSAPRNHFELVPAERYIFIAGGIGITPLLPMVREARRNGAAWQLHYSGRSRSSMAFLDELAWDEVSLVPGMSGAAWTLLRSWPNRTQIPTSTAAVPNRCLTPLSRQPATGQQGAYMWSGSPITRFSPRPMTIRSRWSSPRWERPSPSNRESLFWTRLAQLRPRSSHRAREAHAAPARHSCWTVRWIIEMLS